MRRLLLLSLFIIYLNINLSGCTLTGQHQSKTNNQAQSLSERQKSLVAIEQWTLKGRVSILSKQDAWSGSLFWQQFNPEKYDIRIIAPLGQGTLRLLGSADGVTLTTSDSNKVLKAKNAEILLQQEMGWQMPISGMRYWILGLANPSPYKNLKVDSQGRPKVFEQAGWEIKFLRYKQVKTVLVPDKIVLENDRFKVKVIIKSWQLES